ncbi:MAG TPA: hypothetical protein VHM25_28740 [Polyangiaceae bacterium]|nr:hypothetical protein [Polyangiaceae bacterium]
MGPPFSTRTFDHASHESCVAARSTEGTTVLLASDTAPLVVTPPANTGC